MAYAWAMRYGLSLVLLSVLTACPGDDDPLNNACGTGFNAETGAVGDFGAGDAAQKVEALLQASADLYSAANETEADLLAACTAIATDLGIPAGELTPASGELAVTKACGRVSTEIDAIVATLPNGASLAISITPASCTVDLQVSATCAAECDASITGTAMVECDGELHGSCSASCTGSCAVSGTVNCTGECEGSCTGSCSGTCNGTCSGSCSQMDPTNTKCIGTCSGTCTGSCSATCSGSCSGTCVADVTGSCAGECYGECSATWTAECNGEADVMAQADCKAACDAQANANATCDVPTVTIVGIGLTDTAKAARVTALVATLTVNLPKIIQVQSRLQYAIVPGIAGFTASLRAASTSLASAGVQAAACMKSAIEAVVEASASVNASVSVSVEVSASASASGSAQ